VVLVALLLTCFDLLSQDNAPDLRVSLSKLPVVIWWEVTPVLTACLTLYRNYYQLSSFTLLPLLLCCSLGTGAGSCPKPLNQCNHYNRYLSESKYFLQKSWSL